MRAAARRGLERLRGNDIAAVLLDLCLPDSQGIATFEQVWRAAPHIPILVIGSPDDHDIATQAVRRGAQDYLQKTHLDSYSLQRALRHAIERKVVEEALFFEQQRAEVTLNSIGDAVLSIDISGNVTYLNPVAERMTGWSRKRRWAGRSPRYSRSSTPRHANPRGTRWTRPFSSTKSSA